MNNSEKKATHDKMYKIVYKLSLQKARNMVFSKQIDKIIKTDPSR